MLIFRGGIRHGDVKPGNILLDHKFDARLGDAGLADEVEVGRTHITDTGVVGTHLYYDRHTYDKEEKKYKKKLTNDVYAFGISEWKLKLFSSCFSMCGDSGYSIACNSSGHTSCQCIPHLS